MSRRLCNDDDDKLIINNECVQVDETTESAVTFIEERVYIETPAHISYGQKPYLREFTQADITGDILPINHNLLAENGVVNIVLVTSDKEQVAASNVEFVNENLALISLKGYLPIVGTWSVRVS